MLKVIKNFQLDFFLFSSLFRLGLRYSSDTLSIGNVLVFDVSMSKINGDSPQRARIGEKKTKRKEDDGCNC